MGRSDETYLATIAQVAIAVAGIISVIVVFRREAAWAPNELMGVRLVFENAGAAIVFALLAPLLLRCGLVEGRVWAVGSVGLAAFLAGELLAQTLRWIELEALGAPPRHPVLLVLLFFAPVSCLVPIQVLNVVRWRSFASFGLGLFWLVFAAGFQAAIFLIHATEVQRP
jgi:hypothetical protein